jgi:hypothetical protein
MPDFIEEERSGIVPVNGMVMIPVRVSCITLSISKGAAVEPLSTEMKLRAMNATLKKTLLANLHVLSRCLRCSFSACSQAKLTDLAGEPVATLALSFGTAQN